MNDPPLHTIVETIIESKLTFINSLTDPINPWT